MSCLNEKDCGLFKFARVILLITALVIAATLLFSCSVGGDGGSDGSDSSQGGSDGGSGGDEGGGSQGGGSQGGGADVGGNKDLFWSPGSEVYIDISENGVLCSANDVVELLGEAVGASPRVNVSAPEGAKLLTVGDDGGVAAKFAYRELENLIGENFELDGYVIYHRVHTIY